jgi:hypothetical protein
VTHSVEFMSDLFEGDFRATGDQGGRHLSGTLT